MIGFWRTDSKTIEALLWLLNVSGQRGPFYEIQ